MKNQKNKIKAVIFDMDGVLVDSEPISDKFFKQALEEFGKCVDLEYFEKLRGTNWISFWTTIKNDFGLVHSIEELKLLHRNKFIDYLDTFNDLQPIAGIPELIKHLKSVKYEIAVASSANPKRISKLLLKTGLLNEFEVITSGDDVIEGKPHPEIFLKTAFNLKKQPKECIVIEDSEFGIESAKSAGMKAIGYAGMPHNKQNLSQADLIIKSYAEISSDIIQTL